MSQYIENYLNTNHFKRQLKFLVKKIKNKKVIFYGAGELFRYIFNNFDLSEINIIGISDKSFDNIQQTHYKNLLIIPTNQIKEYDVDYVILSVLNWQEVLISNYKNKIFPKNTKVFPICKSKFKLNSKRLLPIIAESLFHYHPTFLTTQLLEKVISETEISMCKKIQNNYVKIINKIKKKKEKRKIKVAFLCVDDARWKCQSLYELLKQDDNFEPIIFLTKLYTDKPTRHQTEEEFNKTYHFFKTLGMNIQLVYDIKKDVYLDLKKFSPDIVFYQLPFYCHPIQIPEVVSKFALTAYVPYYTGTSLYETVQSVKFRNNLFRYYLADEGLKDYYKSLMGEFGENIRVVGHTSFDVFYKNNIQPDNSNFQVLYSPHHSIEPNSPLHLATFLENGELLLQYAKNHPEISWVFRPHPLLKKVLKTVWTDERIEKYYTEWKAIGQYEEKGNYMDTFFKSNLLINDCSFFREFFPTESPIIQLINPKAVPYDIVSEQVLGTCYNSHDNQELINLLELLIEKREDPLKEQRLKLLRQLHIKNTCASINILNDIKEIFGI